MNYKVKYARHHASYVSERKTIEEAINSAIYLTEEGEGYVKGIYDENDKQVMTLDDVWKVIWRRDEEEETEHATYEVRGDDGSFKCTID